MVIRTRKLQLPSTYRLATTPSERFLASVGRNVVLADVPQRRRLASSFILSHSCSAAFSPCETLLAIKSTSGALAMCELPSLKVLARYQPMHRDEGVPPSFGPDANLLVDTTWSGSLYVRRTHDLSVEKRIEFPGEMLFSLSASTDGMTWMVGHRGKFIDDDGNREPTYLSLWTWPLAHPLRVLSFPGKEVTAAELSPCGTRILVAFQHRDPMRAEVAMLNLEGERIDSVSGGEYVSQLRWSPDSTMLGAVSRGCFLIFTVSPFECTRCVESQYPSDLRFLPRSRVVALGTWERGYLMEMGGY
jgi:hypothetical protein